MNTLFSRPPLPLAILFLTLTTTSLGAYSAEPAFVDEVIAHFSGWDKDHDGALTPNEIEQAVNDPQTKGPAAAAAVALRRAVRANAEIKSLTLDQIKQSVPYRANANLPHYERSFVSAMKRITDARRELFAPNEPRLDSLAQGHLGDCYLIAGLGALVSLDPQRVIQMFQPTPDGQLAVNFTADRKMVIQPPTDGEIALGASTCNGGVWAVAFEKAIGQIFLSRQTSQKHVTPLSVIGLGGSPHTVVEIYTGHHVKRVGCEFFQHAQGDPAAREQKLAEMRDQLADARKNRRIIVGGTAPLGKTLTVPGIYYNHSYAVLEYDREKDVVTFWNPLGNKFTPKGPAGLKNGYPTEYGRFRVPLTEAVQWFGSFSVETDLPAGSKSWKDAN